MIKHWTFIPCLLALAGAVAACSHLNGRPDPDPRQDAVRRALQSLKSRYAPDDHLGIYKVGCQRCGAELVLTGEVDSAEAQLDSIAAAGRAGKKVVDCIAVLPAEELGERVWGISCLSVASAREQPEHKAEMGTQVLMGGIVRIFKPATNNSWFYAQSDDGYLAWFEKGTFVRCTREEADAWNSAPLLVVTALEDRILELPRPDAQPVSDVVLADLVRKLGEAGDWFQVELPDQRQGFLPKQSAENYAAWKQKRRATPENIERTARTFLGRPYLWGGNSPKGLDCSGFTKLVFFLNGVDLSRNATHQARQGQPVSLDADLSHLRKGDLLFFGYPAHRDKPEMVRHVGIYLGDKLFIHSSERVQINSLDPNSPIRDEHRIQTLLCARRVLFQ